MLIHKNTQIKKSAFITILLCVIVLVLAGLWFFSPIQTEIVLRFIFSLIYVLLLPGFVWTYVFYTSKKHINIIERLTLGFTLSFIILPLFIFIATKFNIPLTPTFILFETAVVTILGVVFAAILNRYTTLKN